ncbi:MAG: hypothetical protein JRI23_05980, partial [Deltaproteobacteria bacterium]|nr:hypothetical protein [Deltaproteobacteria bacterium]
MHDEPTGSFIGSYEVLHRVDAQGSEVYLARGRGERHGPRFVLILLELREVDARIIETEVARCQRIEHRCVARPIEMFEHDGKRVVVLDGVPGTSLDRLMTQLRAESERLPAKAVLHIGHSLFAALDAAHSLVDDQGKATPVVHGQLGPHQVMMSWSGAITVMGFGMSRVYYLAESLLAEPTELGAFMAPEQRAGYSATLRGNVYSVAAMLWSLLTNDVPPTDGSKPDSLLARRTDLPAELATLLDQALEPALAQRSVTSRQLAEACLQHGGKEGRRDLRWVIGVIRGLGEGTLDLVSPAAFPPSRLSDVPDGVDNRTSSMPPAAQEEASDGWHREQLEEFDGAGVYAFIGGRSKEKSGAAPSKKARDQSSERRRTRTEPGMPAQSKAKKPDDEAKSEVSSDSDAARLKLKKAVARRPTEPGLGAQEASEPPKAQTQPGYRAPSADEAARPAQQRLKRKAGRARTEPGLGAVTPTPDPVVPAALRDLDRELTELGGASSSRQPSPADTDGPVVEVTELPDDDGVAIAQLDLRPAPTSKAKRAERRTPPAEEPADRVEPLPPPVPKKSEGVTSIELAAPPPVREDDEATPAVEPDAADEPNALADQAREDDEDEPEGFYVRPSLRPGALSEAPFYTPSQFPAAIGGPPFGDFGPTHEVALASGADDDEVPSSADARPRQRGAMTVPFGWAVVTLVAVMLAFVTGIVLSRRGDPEPAARTTPTAAPAPQEPSATAPTLAARTSTPQPPPERPVAATAT